MKRYSLQRLTTLGCTLQTASVSALSYMIVWLFAALAGVYVKSAILSYVTVGRGLGRTETLEMSLRDPSRAYLFSFFERLSFFRSDLLVGFVILPLIGWVILYWTPRRYRMFCVVTVTFAVIAFLYLQLRGYQMVGQFQSRRLWYDSVLWGLKYPADAQKYVGADVLVKLTGCLGVLCVFGALSYYRWKESDRLPSLPVRVSEWTAFTVILVVTAMAWCSPIRPTLYHRSVLLTCLATFFEFDEIDILKYDGLGPEESLAKWREITNSPKSKRIPDYFGAAKDCDVILFVMETAPSRCLDLNANIDDFPNLKRLKERAWIAPNHVSTYPKTNAALFSILTSWYPTYLRYIAPGNGRVTPGMMHSLGASGYATAAYLPYEEDDSLHALGISKIIYADTAKSPNSNLEQITDWHKKIERDRAALELLKADLSGWMRDNRRYAVLFLPQIGHGPWPDVSEDGRTHDTVSRGRGVMALQDKWLGELLSLLEAAGRLEHTIILVTGDHGIRTKIEDPNFVGGMIDPYSFRVPCLLFASKAIQKTVVLPWMTSHIDLSPSILDLLGVTKDRGFELGSPLWEERLRQRTTFFWANEFLGADGFHENGNYYMWHHISDSIYYNSVLDFNNIKPVGKGDFLAKYITQKIVDAMALQHRITHAGSKVEQAAGVFAAKFSPPRLGGMSTLR